MLSSLNFCSIFAFIWCIYHVIAQPVSTQKRQISFNYSNDKVRGVNLGGWFVIEPFITPSLFEVFGDTPPIDEWTYSQALGKSEALSRLENHWATWITEEDFADMRSYGINLVRIPIGYWAFHLQPSDPYVQGQENYLDQAINWARQNGIKVWIDLHGAPGSQNGFDNSGKRDVRNWQQGDNVQATVNVLSYISNKYGSYGYEDVVAGIELLNEPLGPVLNMDGVKQFYNEGYQTVRYSGDNAVVIHDAFQPLGYWNGYMSLPNYYHVILDHHHYQVFSPGELQRTVDQHIGYACQLGWQRRSESLWNVVGEWSAALTDCTKWLNGVGKFARYEGLHDESPYIGSCEGINDLNSWSEQKRTDTRRYIEAQLDSYDQGAGWIFWTYKAENSLEWDLTRLIKGGLFPQPFDSRQFPNQCNF